MAQLGLAFHTRLGPALMEEPLSLPSLSVVSRTPDRYTALKPLCGEPERLTQSQAPGLGGTLQEEPCGQSCSPHYTGEVALQGPRTIWVISGSTKAGWLGSQGWAGPVFQGCRRPLQLEEKDPHPPPPST